MSSKAAVGDPTMLNPEPTIDSETYLQRIAKLQIEADVLLNNKPLNNLRLNKNKSQLYELLKRHNEKFKISTEELPRTQYRLAQLGAKWSQIEQGLVMEKFKIDKRNEETILERPSLFAVPLRNESDFGDYLEKTHSCQIFNQVDAVTNKAQRQIVSQHREAIFSLYMDKTVENRKNMQSQKKNFTFYRKSELFPETFSASSSRLSSKEQMVAKQGNMVMDPKQRNYFEAFSKYIHSKFFYQNRMPEVKNEHPLLRLINELFEITTSYDIKAIWQILSAQVSAAEDFFGRNSDLKDFFEDFKQNPRNYKLGQSPPFEKNLFSLYFSSQPALRLEVLKKSCQLLEEEFSESLPKTENIKIDLSGFKNLDNNTRKILAPVLGFIEKNYLTSDFKEKKVNYIEFDENGAPVWAIFYVLLRAGKVKTLGRLANSYEGSVKAKEFARFFGKWLEKDGLEKQEKSEAMEFFLNSSDDVDVFRFSLFAIMTKYGEIISVDLISQIADYIWFNLRLCEVNEDRLSDSQSRKTMSLLEFQEHFISHYPIGGKNPLVDLKPMFLVMCYEEALSQMKSLESYFTEFIHILIIARESGLIFQSGEDKTKQLLNKLEMKEILYKYVRNFVGSRPLEAFYYLRILPKKEMIPLAASCLTSSELLGYFFDATSESRTNCKRLRDLFGDENFKDLVSEVIKNIKGVNLEMALRLFDLINDYEKVLSLIIEYESQKVLSLSKKPSPGLTREKATSLQNTINSLLASYQSSGKLESCKESNQIIMLLNYMVKIRCLIEDKTNARRFEESLSYLKENKLIPFREEENEKYMDFYIMLERRKSGKVYLELVVLAMQVLRELGIQRSKNSKPSPTSPFAEVKAISSNLYRFFHNYLKNIEQNDPEDQEALKKLTEEAHRLQIVF